MLCREHHLFVRPHRLPDPLYCRETLHPRLCRCRGHRVISVVLPGFKEGKVLSLCSALRQRVLRIHIGDDGDAGLWIRLPSLFDWLMRRLLLHVLFFQGKEH